MALSPAPSPLHLSWSGRRISGKPISAARSRGDSSVSMVADVALSSPASRVAISARILFPLPPVPVTSRKSCQS
ncbi:hypothetical protein DD566_05925 [Klebsiella pneumoniae]|nr:hypothetical protein DD566_05925 [Klebsiella pneumoniae]RXY61435.1 hypothetical protein DD568_19595 [Klebsiella pneumoniae]